MSTEERRAHMLRQAITTGDLCPVPRSLLLSLTNEAAVTTLPTEAVATRAWRTVRVTNGHPSLTVSHVSSEKDPDVTMMELPAGVTPIIGLPGKSSLRQSNGRRRSQRGSTSRVAAVSGFIPQSEPITYNPLPVFDGARRSVSQRREREQGQPTRSRGTSDGHVNIYGADDRINIFPGGYPERCVCRIEVHTQEYAAGPWSFQKRGTGFIVGRRILLTSGHMRPREPFVAWMIKVVPAYYEGQSVYGPAFYTFVTHNWFWDGDAGNDIMVCRLYDPIGDVTGFLGATAYDSRWWLWPVWSMCGYPQDRGELRPTFQGGIRVRDSDSGDGVRLPNGDEFESTQIENDADESSGASGSPLYAWFGDGGAYAIGVHHGYETDYVFPASTETWSAAAGGSALPAIVTWARAEWP